jgi:hypothetical protein
MTEDVEAVRADRLVGSAGVFLIGGIVNCQYVVLTTRQMGGWRSAAEGLFVLYVAVEMTPSEAIRRPKDTRRMRYRFSYESASKRCMSPRVFLIQQVI